MNIKLYKILTVAALSFALFGCKSESANSANANVVASGAGANTNANANVAVNANTATNANANANVKPADNSPKRIAFSKGANWGAANITLAPGASQKFVVGAKKDQTMEVEVSAKETSVNLIKGKAETTEDFGFLNAELQANGDYVFEVKNPTKKEIKTSVKVTINGGDPKSDPTYEEPVPVDDDDEPLESNKKGN